MRRVKLKYRNAVLIFISSFLISASISCTQIEEQYHNFPYHSWNYKDSVTFNIDIKKPGRYSLSLLLRNDANYPYSNIWLSTKVLNSTSNIYNQKISLTLSDNRGNVLGQGPGENIDNRFLIIPELTFNQSGHYSIIINQNMREDVLSGIRSLGIRLKKI